MYELAWEGRGHSPFEPLGDDTTRMKSSINSVVSLIGDVPDLVDEVVLDPAWEGTMMSISSCTDVPEWAKELLGKFTLPKSGKTLREAISGPWEISKDSKRFHFERLSKATGIPLQDMVFFDNEQWNCREISKLGVTVGYSPNGVKRGIWDKAMNAFPASPGDIQGM